MFEFELLLSLFKYLNLNYYIFANLYIMRKLLGKLKELKFDKSTNFKLIQSLNIIVMIYYILAFN